MKLNYKRTFFVGMAFLSICAFLQLYENIVPLILSNTFNLDETLTGVIMALDNVLALFLIPLFGTLSDKVHTRFGRRTPFIITGTTISVVFMMLLPYSDKEHNFLLFILSLGILLVAMGTYRAPAVALMPDLTPAPLRSKANSIINLMGAFGAIITLILTSLLIGDTKNPDYTLVFLIVAVIMIIAVIILVFKIHENDMAKEIDDMNSNKQRNNATNQNLIAKMESSPYVSNQDNIPLTKEVKRSLFFILASIFFWFTAYNALTTAYSRYAVKVWNMPGGTYANTLLFATGAAILSYIPIGIISSYIGRKKTIIIGILMVTLSYFLGFLFTSYSPLINAVFAITGIGWAAISVNSYPMVVEMGRGSDAGKFTSLYYIFSMSAQIITAPLSGFLLQNVSYSILFPYCLGFSLLSLCTMLLVKHGDSRPAKKANVLESFDLDD